MSSWTGKRGNVTYSKPPEPAFLKRFKERVGYKEDHGLSDKFQTMPEATSVDLEDQQDELPQVVQLNDGDISQEDYATILSNEETIGKAEEENKECLTDDGKPMFRKPTSSKRKIEMNSSTRKTKESDATKKKKPRKEEKSNRKLLSFDDVDEDEN